MTILLTGLYTDPDHARAGEIYGTLDRNLANPLIEGVHGFVEDESSFRDRTRLAVHRVSRRMQFADYLIFANARPGRVFIVANSDIYFDESLTLINNINLTDTLVCLSRTEMNKKAPCWDFSHYGDPHYHWPDNSQDAWLFRAPLRPFTCDWTMGIPGCDKKLAHEAAEAGLRLVNPWPEIRAWHNHASRIRRRQPGVALPGPYRDVPPITASAPGA